MMQPLSNPPARRLFGRAKGTWTVGKRLWGEARWCALTEDHLRRHAAEHPAADRRHLRPKHHLSTRVAQCDAIENGCSARAEDSD